MTKRHLIIGVFLAGVAINCFAADQIPPRNAVPAGGARVVPDDWQSAFLKRWRGDKSFGSITTSSEGIDVSTVDKPEHRYDLQGEILNQTAIKSGDTLLVHFAARSIKAEAATGATRLFVVFGKASPPWTSPLSSELALTKQWQPFDIPLKSSVDFDVNEARLSFAFGYTPQEVEVADVDVLDFGQDMPLASLPRTKRYASEVPPEIYNREMARIASMQSELDAIKDPAPAHGKTIYVSADGRSEATGTQDSPFVTIPEALQIAEPGDTILVGAGEYREPRGISINKSGRADAWIKIEAAPGARPKILTSNWSGFALAYGIGYIEINGFEMQFVDDPAIHAFGVGIAPMYATHHIRILNNIIHGYGCGGICSLDCDYIYIEGNTVYDNAKTSPYGGSGISLCRAFDFDDAPGYHNIIRRNVCFDNEQKVITQISSGGNGHSLTDGNGIIIDSLKTSRKHPLINHQLDKQGPQVAYRARTLVENNLCFNNGGRGIHAFRSERVDIINNTCWMNQSTPEINGGEFTAIESSSIVLANNIAVSRNGKRVCSQDGSTGFVIWSHNLLFGQDPLIHKDGIFDKSPLFVASNPGTSPEDFRLQKDSPAVGQALGSIAPTDDLTGTARVASNGIDLGAFQH